METKLTLRDLPAVGRVLQQPLLQQAEVPRSLLVDAVQQVLLARRQALHVGATLPAEALTLEAIAGEVLERLHRQHQVMSPVLNASGTVLHTNLGRAPLALEAMAAMHRAGGYVDLELDLSAGERGRRDARLEQLLCRLTGAEAATVVNNNAAAVMLALAALASGREVVVSRGELVEIGGSFRIPDVMAASGVLLREVGTTNKTHAEDYRTALTAQTALLLKVHTSNYRILGFTAAVSTAELVALGRQADVPVLEDLGSGLLLDLTPYGLPAEPTVAATVATGVDVVTFSGDKLLGGPQAGLLVGRKTAIDRIRRHPMARAFRPDKLVLAALEATLALYLEPATAVTRIPVLRMLTRTAAETEAACQRLAQQLKAALPGVMEIAVVPVVSAVGGGAMPLTELPGFALALQPHALSVDQLAQRLRCQQPPVVARIHFGQLLLDPRTLPDGDEALLVAAVVQALTGED